MNQKLIHEIVATSPRTMDYSSPARARTVRRAIYIERARMKREEPQHPLYAKFDTLVFRISGPCLVVEYEQEQTKVEQQTVKLLNGSTP